MAGPLRSPSRLSRCFGVLLAVLSMACADDGTDTGGDAAQSDGLALYADRCSACHGPDGKGLDNVGPVIRFADRDYATWVVRNGRDEMDFGLAMPVFASQGGLSAGLSDAALASILDAILEPPLPTDGGLLYRGLCGNCHGTAGEGGRANMALAGDRAPSFDLARSRVRIGSGGSHYDRADEYMPSWTEEALPDEAISAIASYLASLPSVGG